MSLNAHVERLNAKHAEIESTIAREELRPHPDTLRITQLKRKKLRLKEELSRLETQH